MHADTANGCFSICVHLRSSAVPVAVLRVSTEVKSVYGVVTVEIKGRAAEFDVLAEPKITRALVGQILLEDLDLIVMPSKTDHGARKLVPNPRSPEMPMVES